MLTQTVIVTNKLDLHARASAKLTQLAARFPCEVWLEKAGRKVNAKSIMGVMMLAAGKGSELTLSAHGEGEVDCLQGLLQLFNDNFGEGE